MSKSPSTWRTLQSRVERELLVVVVSWREVAGKMIWPPKPGAGNKPETDLGPPAMAEMSDGVRLLRIRCGALTCLHKVESAVGGR